MGYSLGRVRAGLGWCLAVAGTGVLTAVLVHLDGDSTPAAMLFLALAVGCALTGGLGPALACSVLGTLALNYWFTPPLHTLRVASAGNLLALVVFVAVSLGVATVVDLAARRLGQARAARSEADTLAMLNRTLLSGEYDVPRLLDLVRSTFGASTAELVPDSSGTPVLEVRGTSLTDADRRVLAAFATHLGVLREREELARQTAAATALESGNRARTALLAAVSHDLRTPLAGIRTAAGTLRRHGTGLAPADRDDLLAAVEESTARLTEMVADLLDMSRLQTGAVEPDLAVVAPGVVLDAALADLEDRDRVTVAEPLPAVVADAVLLERVLANLVGNALRHTRGPVEVTGSAALGSAAPGDATARVRVIDHGEGDVSEQVTRLRGPAAGARLGLAVARGLAEAQGGSVEVEETPGGGLTMVVVLESAR